MLITSYELQKRDRRFSEQRWLTDVAIKWIGPEFDQNRLMHLSAPIPVLQATIKRFDEFAPEFAGVTRRFEMQAQHSLEAGPNVTADDGFLPRSLAYGGAQWPVFAGPALNHELEKKKNGCFGRSIECADYRIRVGPMFPFENIVKAHDCMEHNQALGKIVVLI
jgi:hypothetical protein